MKFDHDNISPLDSRYANKISELSLKIEYTTRDHKQFEQEKKRLIEKQEEEIEIMNKKKTQ